VTRVLAVDWGERRIGLAVSDPQGVIAIGLETLEVSGAVQAAARVAEAAREQGAERIVVGLPLLMSGERGEAAEAAERFAAMLERQSGLPVETYDERFTTTMAGRIGGSRHGDDALAAAHLLEGYLTRLAG